MKMIKKYRCKVLFYEKPVMGEAIQFTGDVKNIQALLDFSRCEYNPKNNALTVSTVSVFPHNPKHCIKTDRIANVGDYIVKTKKGDPPYEECRLLNPDFFEIIYKEIEND